MGSAVERCDWEKCASQFFLVSDTMSITCVGVGKYCGTYCGILWHEGELWHIRHCHGQHSKIRMPGTGEGLESECNLFSKLWQNFVYAFHSPTFLSNFTSFCNSFSRLQRHQVTVHPREPTVKGLPLMSVVITGRA